MLKSIITNFFKKDIIKLGRWEHRNNNKINEIKLLLANYDHCGDIICGNPKDIKKSVENINLYSNKFL
tara:strand:- start:663 stop:866 length:204 start_codon:yes stop_codon:yes gene_type:complete